MKPARVTIKHLFAGYAQAGMDPQHWYENLTEEQRIGAQLDFIEARARLLATRPHDGKDGIPANVQGDANRLYTVIQKAVAAMSQNQMIQACGFMLEAGIVMQRISTQLVTAKALDVTKELQENEEHIRRGLKTLAAARASGKAKNAEYQAERHKYQPYIEDQLQKNPRLTYADLQRLAAREFGVSCCTIKRHTKNPRKK